MIEEISLPQGGHFEHHVRHARRVPLECRHPVLKASAVIFPQGHQQMNVVGHYAGAEEPDFVKGTKVQVLSNYFGNTDIPEMWLPVGSADRQIVDMIGTHVFEMFQVCPFSSSEIVRHNQHRPMRASSPTS